MKRLLIILLFVPSIAFSQTRTINNLRIHGYLKVSDNGSRVDTLKISNDSLYMYTGGIAYHIQGAISPGGGGDEDIYAGDYFINALHGNDTWSGTRADSAWKTITRLNTEITAGNIGAGDTISLRAGQIHYGSIASGGYDGSSGNEVTVTSYGSGKATLTGAKRITSGWTDTDDNNIWKLTDEDLPSTDVDLPGIKINSTWYAIGRYPNSGWLTMDAVNTDTIFYDADITQADHTWDDAQAVIRDSRFTYARSQVHRQTGDSVYLTETTYHALDQGWGYFFQNDTNCLDQNGEWAFDYATQTIYVYWNDELNDCIVDVPTLEEGIYLTGSNYWIIDSLTVEMYYANGLNLSTSDNCHITNNLIQYCGTWGIRNGGSADNNVFQYNTLTNCLNNGVRVYLSTGVQVLNNTMSNIGMIAGMGQAGTDTYTAIIESAAAAGGNIFRYNSISNTGYNGIRFDDNPGDTIQYNYLYHTNSLLDDGGAIYTYTNDAADILIDHNIIIEPLGNVEATNLAANKRSAFGVYIDASSDGGIKIHNNTIYGGNPFYFRGRHLDVKYNTIHTVGDYATVPALITSDGDDADTLTFIGNTCVTDTSTTEFIFYEFDAPHTGNVYDSNHYVAPFRTDNAVFYHAGYHSFAEWQLLKDSDVHSDTALVYYSGTGLSAKDSMMIFQYNYSADSVWHEFEDGYYYYTMDATEVTDSFSVPPYGSTMLYRSAIELNLDPGPVVENIYASGSYYVTDTVYGHYTYVDDDPEGSTELQWYSADDVSMTGWAAISGATDDTLALTSDLYDKYIFLRVLPIASAGVSPGVADTSAGYYIDEYDYYLTNADSAYIDLVTEAFSNLTKWAVYFEMSNYAEVNSGYGYVFGNASTNTYGALSRSGKLTCENTTNVEVTSTINETVVKDADWDTIMFFADGTNFLWDVNHGTNTSSAAPASGGPAMTIGYLMNAFANVNGDRGADGNFNNFKIFDLTEYTNDWVADTILATATPKYIFKFNEGTGDTVWSSDQTLKGAIIYDFDATWVKNVPTYAYAVTISSDGSAGDERGDQASYYDLDSNKSWFVWKGADGDPYIAECDHDDDDTWSTPVKLMDETDNSHSYSAMTVSDSGYIVVIFNDYQTSELYCLRSVSPCTIGDGFSTYSFEDDYPYDNYFSEYPRILKARNGDLIIPMKQRPGVASGDAIRRWLYLWKSEDDGATWGDRTLAIERSHLTDSMTEVYMSRPAIEPYRNGEPERWWFSWIAAGGPGHDDYHEDLYCAYYIPDSAKWYAPTGKDLGVKITYEEQEGDSGNIQIFDGGSPGYYYFMSVNSDGVPIVGDYKWNTGTESWDYISTLEEADWRHGYYWKKMATSLVQRSTDSDNWTDVEDLVINPSHGGDALFFKGVDHYDNISCFEFRKENHDPAYTGGNMVQAYNGRAEGTAEVIIITADNRTLATSGECNIKAFVCEEKYGAIDRVTDATNELTLAIISGGGSIGGTNPQSATAGKCTWTYTAPGTAGKAVLEVTGSGLTTCRIDIYFE